MIIFDHPDRFAQFHQSCVATIGKFDGVHLGHQLILDQLKQRAEELNLPTLVILLEPHPEEFFAGPGGEPPARLNVVREKLELLENFGVDFVFQLNFDEKISSLSADSYIEEILVQGLGVAVFIIGNDFRFGFGRQGDFALLQQRGSELGFEVEETASYEYNGVRISSSYIRQELAVSNFALVEQLLGRPYSIRGEVQQGRQLARNLGYPTCNVGLQRLTLPLHGVFACEVRLADRSFNAAVNVGYKPTVTDERAALLEAHLLDFDEDLYGKSIEVIFRNKIREEMKFDGLDALKTQMSRDIDKVREMMDVLAAQRVGSGNRSTQP